MKAKVKSSVNLNFLATCDILSIFLSGRRILMFLLRIFLMSDLTSQFNIFSDTLRQNALILSCDNKSTNSFQKKETVHEYFLC